MSRVLAAVLLSFAAVWTANDAVAQAMPEKFRGVIVDVDHDRSQIIIQYITPMAPDLQANQTYNLAVFNSRGEAVVSFSVNVTGEIGDRRLVGSVDSSVFHKVACGDFVGEQDLFADVDFGDENRTTYFHTMRISYEKYAQDPTIYDVSIVRDLPLDNLLPFVRPDDTCVYYVDSPSIASFMISASTPAEFQNSNSSIDEILSGVSDREKRERINELVMGNMQLRGVVLRDGKRINFDTNVDRVRAHSPWIVELLQRLGDIEVRVDDQYTNTWFYRFDRIRVPSNVTDRRVAWSMPTDPQDLVGRDLINPPLGVLRRTSMGFDRPQGLPSDIADRAQADVQLVGLDSSVNYNEMIIAYPVQFMFNDPEIVRNYLIMQYRMAEMPQRYPEQTRDMDPQDLEMMGERASQLYGQLSRMDNASLAAAIREVSVVITNFGERDDNRVLREDLVQGQDASWAQTVHMPLVRVAGTQEFKTYEYYYQVRVDIDGCCQQTIQFPMEMMTIRPRDTSVPIQVREFFELSGNE